MTNLVVIDTNTFLHAVITQTERNQNISLEDKMHILKFNAMYMLGGAYLQNILAFKDEPLDVVWAMDMNPYWRTPKLSAIGCNYKKKAGTASHRSQLVEPLREVLNDFLLSTFDTPLFTMYKDLENDLNDDLVAFEADDIAAGIVYSFRHQYNHVYLITDDCDWLPLTQFLNVTWLGAHGREPRVRDSHTAIQWIRNTYHEVKKTKERQKFEFHTLNDLWRFKAYFGDTSDNIPGDKKDKCPDRYLPFIDLLHPLEGFKCWEQSDFKEKFKNSTKSRRKIMSLSQLSEINEGIPLAIYPYSRVSAF